MLFVPVPSIFWCSQDDDDMVLFCHGAGVVSCLGRASCMFLLQSDDVLADVLCIDRGDVQVSAVQGAVCQCEVSFPVESSLMQV